MCGVNQVDIYFAFFLGLFLFFSGNFKQLTRTTQVIPRPSAADKNADFRGILTRIIGVLGEHADQLTTTTTKVCSDGSTWSKMRGKGHFYQNYGPKLFIPF